MKKFLLILIPIVILAIAGFYWFFMRSAQAPSEQPNPSESTSFDPFGRNPGTANGGTTNGGGVKATNTPTPTGISTEPVTNTEGGLPRLRHLSSTPIGGFMASSTASTTLTRFIDRGVGHIFEARATESEIPKISNTTIPRVYESFWNKNGTAAVLRYVKDETGVITNFYAEVKKVVTNASSTEVATIPYEVKGKYLSANIKAVAVSPKGDRIFTLNLEDGKSVGYVSGFDESKKTKVFETPLKQLTVDWPEENTLVVSTKASGQASGFIYFVDLKKPYLRRVLGDMLGLTAKASADAKKVIYSLTSQQKFTTRILNFKENTSQDVTFKTIAEKCVWSKLHPNEVYCAVPAELPAGTYPDDWYKGNISFYDQIWHLDTLTGEVHIIGNLFALSNSLIDVINPTLDPKENFLYFMNKRDLTMWSLDLTK
jgi:hypothetical protein